MFPKKFTHKFPIQLKKFTIGLLISILILSVIEGIARIGYTLREDIKNTNTSGQWYVNSPELMWELKPNFRGMWAGGERNFDARGFRSVDTSQVQDTSKPEIVFIGDSNTFGVSVSTESTFVEVLDRLLPDIHAINLGVPGYTSY